LPRRRRDRRRTSGFDWANPLGDAGFRRGYEGPAPDRQPRTWGSTYHRCILMPARDLLPFPPSPQHKPRMRMYHHIKKLMYTVRVGEPEPAFGKELALGQFPLYRSILEEQ